ncbi:MAG: PstS family phosphate ABC transporter substrate-binding protein [Fusobacteriaceae bacterium]
MKKGFLFGLMVMAGLLGGEKALANKVVQVKGSDTLLNASQYIAEKFMAKNKDARIAVTGGGSGVGISALQNGTTDIAMASRNIKQSEIDNIAKKGITVEEIVVGYDGITIVGNKSNNISNLTSDQLGKIYRGEIKNWKEVGGPEGAIVILSRDSSSGTHEFFKEHVVRKGNSKGPEEYATTTLYMPSNEAIKQEVAKNKFAVGYLGMGYVDNTTKSFNIDGVPASAENVLSKKYPIAREIFWYANKARTGTVKNLVDFAVSAEGQKIVKEEGFVPVK